MNRHMPLHPARRCRRCGNPRQARPRIRLTPYAWTKLLYLRDLGETEVGAFGVSAPHDLLLVSDVQLVHQQCSSVSVKFDDSSVADYFDRQVNSGLAPAQFSRVWIHTHPGRSPAPSRADEETFTQCISTADWSIMLILARSSRTYARLRLGSDLGLDVQLAVEIDFHQPFAASDLAAWEAEYEQAVSVETPMFCRNSLSQDRPSRSCNAPAVRALVAGEPPF